MEHSSCARLRQRFPERVSRRLNGDSAGTEMRMRRPTEILASIRAGEPLQHRLMNRGNSTL
jgi:hypothetical protein